jgi:hypothetical protein
MVEMSVVLSQWRTYSVIVGDYMVKSRRWSELNHVLILGETIHCHHPRQRSQKENEEFVLLEGLTVVGHVPGDVLAGVCEI